MIHKWFPHDPLTSTHGLHMIYTWFTYCRTMISHWSTHYPHTEQKLFAYRLDRVIIEYTYIDLYTRRWSTRDPHMVHGWPHNICTSHTHMFRTWHKQNMHMLMKCYASSLRMFCTWSKMFQSWSAHGPNTIRMWCTHESTHVHVGGTCSPSW